MRSRQARRRNRNRRNGGAAFSTHVKLQVRQDTPIYSVIINGAECEPHITTDNRLVQERTAELSGCLGIIRRTVGAEKGYVACEINKPEAVDSGKALTSRVLTISSSVVAEPGNSSVPVGTWLRDLVAAAGGATISDYRLVVGGPMTGTLTEDLDLPVT